MIVSRNSLSLAALLIGLGLAAPSLAQQQIGPPLKLVPPGQDPGKLAAPKLAPGPSILVPPPGAVAAPSTNLAPTTPVPPPPPPPVASTITAEPPTKQPLTSVETSPTPSPAALREIDGRGIADQPLPGEPTLGGKQWAETPREIALALIGRLPATVASPSLRGLAARMLAAAATPPAAAAPATGADSGPSLIGLRVRKLSTLADAATLAGVIASVPTAVDDPLVARARLDQLWLAGQNDQACAALPPGSARLPDPYWLEAKVTCDALANKTVDSGLGAQLLRDEGVDDPTFFALIEILGGGKTVKLPEPPVLTPLTLTLMRAAKRDVGAEGVRAATGPIARSIATVGGAPWPLRVLAAERAAATGALDAPGLARFYASAELGGDDAGAAKADGGAKGRALMFRAAQGDLPAASRADLSRSALGQPRDDGYLVLAEAYRSSFEKLAPAPELDAAAGDVARALIAAGAVEAAQPWTRGLASRDSDPERQAQARRLWAVTRLATPAGARPPIAAADLANWSAAERKRDPVGFPARAGLLFTLLQALGDKIPAENWKPLLDPTPEAPPPAKPDPKAAKPTGNNAAIEPPAPVASAGQLAELRDAVAGQRPAEAIALAVILAGDRRLGAGDALVAGEVTRALLALGHARAARGFAVEVALQAGL